MNEEQQNVQSVDDEQGASGRSTTAQAPPSASDQLAEPDACYHADDLRAAIERARAIRGQVIWSWAPGTRPADNEYGYWSDSDQVFLRFGERIVWPDPAAGQAED